MTHAERQHERADIEAYAALQDGDATQETRREFEFREFVDRSFDGTWHDWAQFDDEASASALVQILAAIESAEENDEKIALVRGIIHALVVDAAHRHVEAMVRNGTLR